jgi:two-component system response regulator FixJ
VRDSGPGIAPDALPRLFEPFFTTRDGGLGLGLSLCETLATGMGGALSAGHATPRAAPSSRCVCPLAPTTPAHARHEHPHLAPDPLVDDDDAVREALALLIGTVGLRVQAWADPQAFVDGFDREAIGAIVLDVRMPGLSGLTVLDLLRQQGVDQPVVMLTGHGTVELCRRAFKAGAAEFLEKPVDDEALLEALQQRRAPACALAPAPPPGRGARALCAAVAARTRGAGAGRGGPDEQGDRPRAGAVARAPWRPPRPPVRQARAQTLAQMIRHYAQLVDDDARHGHRR